MNKMFLVFSVFQMLILKLNAGSNSLIVPPIKSVIVPPIKNFHIACKDFVETDSTKPNLIQIQPFKVLEQFPIASAKILKPYQKECFLTLPKKAGFFPINICDIFSFSLQQQQDILELIFNESEFFAQKIFVQSCGFLSEYEIFHLHFLIDEMYKSLNAFKFFSSVYVFFNNNNFIISQTAPSVACKILILSICVDTFFNIKIFLCIPIDSIKSLNYN